MIKRPLNEKFTQAVKNARKITTIRAKPWAVGVPIMLYNWSGKPYRSKQIDVAPVMVEDTQRIRICRNEGGVGFIFMDPGGRVLPRELWECEGFDSRKDMEDWFMGKMKPGTDVVMHLMRFRRIPEEVRRL